MNLRSSLYRSLVIVVVIALLLPQSTAPGKGSAALASALVFTKHTIDDALTLASSAYSADLDGDGDMDVIGGALSSEGLALWENDGSGGLTKRRKLSSARVRELYATDLDGDGDVDIVFSSFEWLYWYRNDGDWNFAGGTVAPFYGAWAIHAADVDGDGDVDVLGTSHGGGAYDAGRVAWWENDGQENFTRHLLTGSNSGRDQNAAVGTDMDGDGDLDILCAAGYNENLVYWFENSGNGTFVSRHTVAEAGPESVNVADVDRDGDLDVVSSDAWYENDGTQVFTPHATGPGRAVYPVDLDGDADVDIVTEMAWYENNGAGNFTQHRHGTDWLNPNAYVAYASDLDKDGDLDIVAPDCTDESSLVWWESTASEDWPDFALEALTISPSQPEVMDSAGIFLDIRNVGSPYVPDRATVQVEVKLRTSTGKEYLWVFPGALDALDADESTSLDIYPFIFYDSAINEIQVCITSDDAEANPANNCRTKTLTVTAPVLPWRACIGVLISIADALLAATPAKQAADGAKLITHIFVLQIPGMVVACSEADEKCADAVTAFLVDSAISLGKLVGGATVLKVLDVGHAAIQAFKDSLGCGDYLGASLRAWVENSNHRSVKVNAVAVRSPAYVRVVDSSDRRAGFLDDGSIVSEIPDADVFQLDGEKYILYPGDDTAMVELKGTGTGTFDLIVSLSRPGSRIATVEYLGVSVTAATRGKIDATGTDYSLALDDNGDGTADRIVQPDEITEEEIHQVRLPAVMTTE